MKCTEIRVTFGYTYNLGDYSNIRPEVSLTAELNDDLQDALNHLYETARGNCHRMIDDALEAEGKPAHFSPEPRFIAYTARDEKLTIIVSQDSFKQFEAEHPHWNLTKGYHEEGYRFQHLWTLLEKHDMVEGYHLLIFGHDTIPQIEPVFECQLGNMLFVGRGKMIEALPPFLSAAADWQHKYSYHRNFDTFETEMRAKASEHGLTFFNISDFDDWQYEEKVIALRTAYEKYMKKTQQLDEEKEDDIPFDDDEGEEDDYEDEEEEGEDEEEI